MEVEIAWRHDAGEQDFSVQLGEGNLRQEVVPLEGLVSPLGVLKADRREMVQDIFVLQMNGEIIVNHYLMNETETIFLPYK